MSKHHFRNENPEGNRISDCVSRAIKLATGLSYKTVNRLLSLTAEQYNCDKLCVCCYKHLLSHTLGYDRYKCKPGVSVADVADDFRNEIVLIRIREHLTCACYGVVLDTWDCSDQEVDCFWVVS